MKAALILNPIAAQPSRADEVIWLSCATQRWHEVGLVGK
jgi:hypothetical protein